MQQNNWNVLGIVVGGIVESVIVGFAVYGAYSLFCNKKIRINSNSENSNKINIKISSNTDPIGISLEEGREIEMISLKSSSVYFDYEGSGVLNKTSWIGSKDAILFYDYDNSGIADYNKIVLTSWAEGTTSDFAALLEVFDYNIDKVFDKEDTSYSDFYLWQDKNSDGVVDEGELVSLEEAGVEAIDFRNTKEGSEAQQAEGIQNTAEVLWQDGRVTTAYDLTFEYEAAA